MGIDESRREGSTAQVHGTHIAARPAPQRLERPHGFDPVPANEHRLAVSIADPRSGPARVEDAPAVEKPPRFRPARRPFHRRAT